MVSKMYDFSVLSISFYNMPLFALLLPYICVTSHLLHYLFSSKGYLDVRVCYSCSTYLLFRKIIINYTDPLCFIVC